MQPQRWGEDGAPPVPPKSTHDPTPSAPPVYIQLPTSHVMDQPEARPPPAVTPAHHPGGAVLITQGLIAVTAQPSAPL